MRAVIHCLALLAAYPISAQWYQVYYGQCEYVIMTAPAAGFCTKSTFMSPSSGGYYDMRYTTNEWASSTELFSDQFSSYFTHGRGLNRCDDSTIFYFRYFAPGVPLKAQASSSSPTDWNDTNINLGFEIPYSPKAIVPINDTLAYFPQIIYDDTIFPVRVFAFHPSFMESSPPPVTEITGVDPYSIRLAFRDVQLGALTVTNIDGAGSIWTTTNGSDWELRHEEETVSFRDVIFLDAQTIWAMGDVGTIHRSLDQGETWETLLVPTSDTLWSADGYSVDSVWVAGTNGAVYSTGDGGVNWNIHSGIGATVERIQTLDGAVYAYTVGGGLWRYDPTNEAPTAPSTLSWWSYSDIGLSILNDEDETITHLAMYDVSGRSVDPGISGSEVDMRPLPAGLYIMTFESNKRQETGKILWLSKDP